MNRSGNIRSRTTCRGSRRYWPNRANTTTASSHQPGNPSFWPDMQAAHVKMYIVLPLLAAPPKTVTKGNIKTTLVPRLPGQEGGGDGFRVNI
jgi:hypothetical protein